MMTEQKQKRYRAAETHPYQISHSFSFPNFLSLSVTFAFTFDSLSLPFSYLHTYSPSASCLRSSLSNTFSFLHPTASSIFSLFPAVHILPCFYVTLFPFPSNQRPSSGFLLTPVSRVNLSNPLFRRFSTLPASPLSLIAFPSSRLTGRTRS